MCNSSVIIAEVKLQNWGLLLSRKPERDHKAIGLMNSSSRAPSAADERTKKCQKYVRTTREEEKEEEEGSKTNSRRSFFVGGGGEGPGRRRRHQREGGTKELYQDFFRHVCV